MLALGFLAGVRRIGRDLFGSGKRLASPRLRLVGLAATLALGSLLIGPAHASLVRVNFDGAAGGLGTFSGMFSGDTDGDEILTLAEVDSFSISFSGPTTNFATETITGATSLLRFEFDAATNSFLEGPDVNRGSTGPLNIPFFLVVFGNALSVGTDIFFGDGVDDFLDEGDPVTSLTIEQTVPEPGSFALLAVGLLGAAVSRRRRTIA
jgi:hypothetical protein